MNEYQVEHLDAFSKIRTILGTFSPATLRSIEAEVSGYLAFRHRLDQFLTRHFDGYCTSACYRSQRSACCSKDGIIVFWADVVINALGSRQEDLDAVETAIRNPVEPRKCIFLGRQGCLWKIRPLLCAMFLCDGAYETVLHGDRDLERQWDQFQQESKSFRWPDRPVLFDRLEQCFMDLGCRSSLMHLNTSPGLLRIKRRAGLLPTDQRAA